MTATETRPPTITSRTQYEILRLFADGKTELEIADFTTVNQGSVRRTVNEFCAGDRDIARTAVAVYERRASMVAAAQGKPGVPGVPRTTTVPPAGTLRPAGAPVPHPGAPVPHPGAPVPSHTLAQLLAAAAESPHQRTRTLGEKIRALTGDLRSRLAEEHRAAQGAAQAAAARAEAQKRVEELAAELEKAKAVLRAASSTSASPAPSTAPTTPAKTVRAWAAENGVECPARGQIPRTVLDAYRTATSQEGK